MKHILNSTLIKLNRGEVDYPYIRKKHQYLEFTYMYAPSWIYWLGYYKNNPNKLMHISNIFKYFLNSTKTRYSSYKEEYLYISMKK